jgi:hypothetical protein
VAASAGSRPSLCYLDWCGQFLLAVGLQIGSNSIGCPISRVTENSSAVTDNVSIGCLISRLDFNWIAGSTVFLLAVYASPVPIGVDYYSNSFFFLLQHKTVKMVHFLLVVSSQYTPSFTVHRTVYTSRYSSGSISDILAYEHFLKID